MTSFVVHYQEIALKGKNRPWFLTRLIRNLRRAVSDLDVTAVKSVMGRIEVVLGPTADPAQVGERIRRTFGIANFSYAGRAPLGLGKQEQGKQGANFFSLRIVLEPYLQSLVNAIIPRRSPAGTVQARIHKTP